MNVTFLTLAEQEIDEAFTWFEQRAEGKGLEFLDELDRVVRLVRAYRMYHLRSNPKFADVYLRDFRMR